MSYRALAFPVVVGALAALAVPNAACVSCTEEAWGSVVVTVVDTGGVKLTDATVQYQVDGGPAVDCTNEGGSTLYTCGSEVSGHFVITATRGAAQKTAETDVDHDSCHVIPTKLTIALPVTVP
jgi:hypothetical protein